MPMRNAYLIIAHGNYSQLEKLIKYLDCKNTDFYIHINSMVDMPDEAYFKGLVKESKLFFTDRAKVVWGEYGILEAMLIALETALLSGHEYDYYHVLTGVDLPIKTKKYINNFLEANLFNNRSNGRLKTNYLYVDDFMTDETLSRVTKYNLLVKYWRYQNKYIQKTARGINKLGYLLQKMIGVNRFRDYDGVIYKGAPWWSVTNECAQFIVSHKEWMKQRFSYMTFGADELAIQTLIMNSDFRNSLFSPIDKCTNNMNVRLIDWKRGRPYTWRIKDFDELISTEHLFARKFDERIDQEIIDKMYDYLNESEE